MKGLYFPTNLLHFSLEPNCAGHPDTYGLEGDENWKKDEILAAKIKKFLAVRRVCFFSTCRYGRSALVLMCGVYCVSPLPAQTLFSRCCSEKWDKSPATQCIIHIASIREFKINTIICFIFLYWLIEWNSHEFWLDFTKVKCSITFNVI